MATALDIHIDQGSDVRVPIAFIDDFSELDLTGISRISIEKETLTLLWPHEVTENLPAGSYVYDLELASEGGEVTRVLSGRVQVCKEVTQWPTATA